MHLDLGDVVSPVACGLPPSHQTFPFNFMQALSTLHTPLCHWTFTGFNVHEEIQQ